MRQIKIKSL